MGITAIDPLGVSEVWAGDGEQANARDGSGAEAGELERGERWQNAPMTGRCG